ncbi:MAG: adenosylcobinamide-GDP ribazoletransferase [Clostridia bacterium]|nr:adenosylcobinamide-GDP ribazoletransferase [Clostridia bacterium]
MKTLWETFCVAFSMFSRVPAKQVTWTEDNRRYAMLAFPAVGIVLGLCWMALTALCAHLEVPALLTGALLTALPLLVVGGIHLDGYADTWDALASHGDREEKRRILKDPHTGAFAIIHLVVFFLLWFAAASVLAEKETATQLVVALGFVLSRALSALAVTTFPMASDSGLAQSFSASADKAKVRAGLIALLVVLALAFLATDVVLHTFPAGLLVFGVSVVVFVWYRYIAAKHFGGISGDLAGWFLCRCEVWMLVAAAFAPSVL